MTGDEAGAAIDRSGSWISRVETGRVGLRARDLRDLLDLYRVTDPGRRKQLEEWAEQGNQRGWWSRYAEVLPDSYSTYIGLEAGARSLHSYENAVIPGLLQTPDYIRAVMRQTVPLVDPKSIDRLVRVRLKRQELQKQQGRPTLSAIVEESVLFRAIGGQDVLRAQLASVLRVVEDGHADLRILPFSRSDHILLATAFTVLSFEDDPDIAYVETATGGIFEEDPDAQVYRSIYKDLSQVALDPEATITALHKALERLT